MPRWMLYFLGTYSYSKSPVAVMLLSQRLCFGMNVVQPAC